MTLVDFKYKPGFLAEIYQLDDEEIDKRIVIHGFPELDEILNKIQSLNLTDVLKLQSIVKGERAFFQKVAHNPNNYRDESDRKAAEIAYAQCQSVSKILKAKKSILMDAFVQSLSEKSITPEN